MVVGGAGDHDDGVDDDDDDSDDGDDDGDDDDDDDDYPNEDSVPLNASLTAEFMTTYIKYRIP